MTRGPLLAALVVIVATLAYACSSSSSESSSSAPNAFFERFVTDDGRVVRHDQGGDTVSEGQAYALLLAAEHRDAQRFRRVWEWTQENLQREDRLFAWHWKDGHIVDESPAADADVDVAHALLLAARLFEDDGLADAGRQVAEAVLEHETIESGSGRLLVAGPWARSDRTINPSYLAVCTFGELAELTGDDRWKEVAASSLAVLHALLDNRRLPPDWARVDDSGTVKAMAAPNKSQGEPRYGLDAVRVAPRLAACGEGRELAASMWPRLRALRDDGAAIAYSLAGTALSDIKNAAGIVGAAAAAEAAGDADAARRLLERAAELEREQPTYFGSAWLALGTRSGSQLVALEMAPVAAIAAAETTTTSSTTTSSTTSTTSTSTSTTTSTTAPTSSTTGSSTSSSSTSSSSTTSTTVKRSQAGAGGTTTTTMRRQGALSSPTPRADELLSTQRGTATSVSTERRGRSTGAIIAGGIVVAVLLGIVLGLRERAHVRRVAGLSPPTPNTRPG